MRDYRKLKITALLRRELLENKTLVIFGPLILAALSIVVVFFIAIFADRLGSTLGGPLVGQFLQDLNAQVIEHKSDVDLHFSNSEEGGAYSLRSFSSKSSTANFGEHGVDNFGQNNVSKAHESLILNDILYALHNLLMLVPFFVAISYLLRAFFYDRLDGSYYFWRSMPVSAREEVLTKIVVALFIISGAYLCASLVIQILSLLIFVFPIYRIGLDPIPVVLENFDFIAWFWHVVLDWVKRGFLFAPIFAWILFASAIAVRSASLVALLPVAIFIAIERIFLGTSEIFDNIVCYLPPPFSSQYQSLQNPITLIIGLVFAFSILAMATFFRRNPIFIKS